MIDLTMIESCVQRENSDVEMWGLRAARDSYYRAIIILVSLSYNYLKNIHYVAIYIP